MGWVLTQPYNSPNRHMVPEYDLVEHILSTRCSCKPRWKARVDTSGSMIVWTFVHQPADGRPTAD